MSALREELTFEISKCECNEQIRHSAESYSGIHNTIDNAIVEIDLSVLELSKIFQDYVIKQHRTRKQVL